MASPSSAPRRSRQSTDAMADYRIEEKAGKGSFATVFKGRHRVSLLVIPLRVLFESFLQTPMCPFRNSRCTENRYCGETELGQTRHARSGF